MRSGVKSSELVSFVLSFQALLAYHGRKMHGRFHSDSFNFQHSLDAVFRLQTWKKDAERPAGQGVWHSRWTGTDPCSHESRVDFSAR